MSVSPAPTDGPVRFQDLRPAQAGIAVEVANAITQVLESGWYILGAQVQLFEAAFAEFCGAEHCVGVGNGTDAIALGLWACGVEPGDEVITTAHTALATLCAISQIGAIPVLADIEPDGSTLDPARVQEVLTPRTRAVVPVHLYGHAADIVGVMRVADSYGLSVIEDCAQAHGARVNGRVLGTFGRLGAFSFYPTKNLGAYGDGGAVITDDAAVAERVRRLRNYGQTDRYHHAEPGMNSRLDELHAAILQVKLTHLAAWTTRRRELARRYSAQLAGLAPRLRVPEERTSSDPVYHLYVVRTSERDELQAHLRAQQIETLIHYPVPAHLQPAYAHLGMGAGTLPETERAADEVLSLPMYPELPEDHVDRVCEAIHAFFRMRS